MASKLQPLIVCVLSRKDELLFNSSDTPTSFAAKNSDIFNEFSIGLPLTVRRSVSRKVINTLLDERWFKNMTPQRKGGEVLKRSGGGPYQFTVIHKSADGRFLICGQQRIKNVII